MMIARYLNMDTSLRVFCGNHLPPHATKEISDKYWAVTQALELAKSFLIPLDTLNVLWPCQGIVHIYYVQLLRLTVVNNSSK